MQAIDALDTRSHHAGRAWVGLAAPSLLLAGAAVGLGLWLGDSPALSATELNGYEDIDQDGLDDHHEALFGTDYTKWDSDGDGYGDLEELARKSDGWDPASVPSPATAAVGMSANVKDGQFNVLTATYFEDGKIQGADMTVGVYWDGFLIPLPPEVWLYTADIHLNAGADASDLVLLFDTAYPDSVFQSLGDFSLYATLTPPGSSVVTAADAIDMTSMSGVPVLVEFSLQGSTGVSLYKPIPPPESIPSSWSSNQVCSQVTSLVGGGGAGPVTVHEVESADCKSASSSSCSSADCSATVGSEVERLDPLGLIGG